MSGSKLTTALLLISNRAAADPDTAPLKGFVTASSDGKLSFSTRIVISMSIRSRHPPAGRKRSSKGSGGLHFRSASSNQTVAVTLYGRLLAVFDVAKNSKLCLAFLMRPVVVSVDTTSITPTVRTLMSLARTFGSSLLMGPKSNLQIPTGDDPFHGAVSELVSANTRDEPLTPSRSRIDFGMRIAPQRP